MVRLLFLLLITGCANNGAQLQATTHPLSALSQLISKHGQVQSSEIQNRIDSIVKKLQISSSYFKVIVLNSDTINAYAGGDNIIVITLPLYKLAKDDDQLAFVISHELGHLMLHNNLNSNNLDNNQRQTIELEADQFAITIMSRAGFDSNKGISILLSDNFNSCQHATESYLPATQRYFKLLR